MNDYEPIITVLGPTATGKTGVAVRIAAELGGEIVSADSRQVFRRMDIGSGKDLSEYQYDGNPIPYQDKGFKFTLTRTDSDWNALKDAQNKIVYQKDLFDLESVRMTQRIKLMNDYPLRYSAGYQYKKQYNKENCICT